MELPQAQFFGRGQPIDDWLVNTEQDVSNRMITAETMDDASAIRRLNAIGMTLGEWHRLEYAAEQTRAGVARQHIHMPSDANELLAFSHQVLDWLPDSNGYIIVADYSSSFDEAQLQIVQSIVGTDLRDVSKASGALLMPFADRNPEVKVRLSYFIFFSLLFAAHFYVVSAEEYEGPILGIIDEFAYFIGKKECGSRIDSFAAALEKGEKSSPSWLLEYLAKHQPV